MNSPESIDFVITKFCEYSWVLALFAILLAMIGLILSIVFTKMEYHDIETFIWVCRSGKVITLIFILSIIFFGIAIGLRLYPVLWKV